MYKLCVTEQSARRQRELEAGLLAAMKSQPYEDITVSSLCDEMHIPRKSFYRYFSSKDGALYALIDHTMMDFTGEFFSTEISVTIGTLERYFLFWRNQAALLDALRRSGLSGILVQRSILRAAEEELVSSKLFRQKEKCAQLYMVNFLVSGLVSIMLQWHDGGFAESPRELALIAADILTRNLIEAAFE